jgi:hypothetical protein
LKEIRHARRWWRQNAVQVADSHHANGGAYAGT